MGKRQLNFSSSFLYTVYYFDFVPDTNTLKLPMTRFAVFFLRHRSVPLPRSPDLPDIETGQQR
jgi:hypothetical protein